MSITNRCDFKLLADANKHDKKEETQEKLETSNDQKRGLETRLFNGMYSSTGFMRQYKSVKKCKRCL